MKNDTKATAKAVVATPVSTQLPKDVFDVEIKNHNLLKLAYDAYLATARQASATTKTRGKVSGGGKKPWKQKGTGRARFGSSRNPIWRGGGIVFGPLGNENYKIKISTHAKRQAVRQALTLANQAGKIVVLDFKPTGKTADAVKFFKDNQLNRKTLLVVDEKTPALLRSTNNIQNVLLVSTTYLTVYHIMNADTIVLSAASLPTLSNWLVTPKNGEEA
ncbi:MAG: 50S ribosomal protein L4 [Candidatus Microsaccharimonas sossegonensis]|uniref:Large ribosomal subunit protein uL4 n=1 Tax=Candidatus Microsaccharimonas sossegonensis TaxID=2506948 RepID=A0A4Q0AIC6_9BACT|nr:MAG: 50S ribosomal protein L4 [Candidatus Microsaccharimonas sossegonensis]